MLKYFHIFLFAVVTVLAPEAASGSTSNTITSIPANTPIDEEAEPRFDNPQECKEYYKKKFYAKLNVLFEN